MSETNVKKIGIIQLTRIGDVIQTLQAAKQLKKDHPEAQLHLVARKQMAAGLAFLLDEVFESVLYLDVKEIIPSRDFPLESALAKTKEFTDQISALGLDVLINLSFNKSSSYLTAISKARFKMGVTRNEMNQLVVNDKWSQYVYSSVMNSTLNPFNLVDIFKFILGAKTFSPTYEERKRENKIVLHPFASTKKKRWGVNKWTDLLYKVLKENPEYDVYMVGAPSEAKEALALEESAALGEFKARFHNLVGKTSIQETYTLLSSAKILISHDSMVSHLAALTQTPTVVLSLGPVRPSETTPYQHNVLNIVPRRSCFPCRPESACELLPCHKDISHQLTSQIIGEILREETLDKEFFSKEVSPFYLNSVSVFAPNFTTTGMELVDITEAKPSAEDVFRTFYRIIWSYYLKGIDASYPLPELSNETLATLVEHQKGSSYIYELYTFGMKYANAIVKEARNDDPSIAKIQENIAKLSEIDELAALTKKTYPMLKPIVDFFFVNKANAQGENIVDITQSNLLSFYEAQGLVKVLYDLAERIVGPRMKASTSKNNAEV